MGWGGCEGRTTMTTTGWGVQTRGNGQDNQLGPDLRVISHTSEPERTEVWRTRLLPGSQARSPSTQAHPGSYCSIRKGDGDRRISSAMVRLSWTPKGLLSPGQGQKLQPSTCTKTRYPSETTGKSESAVQSGVGT